MNRHRSVTCVRDDDTMPSHAERVRRHYMEPESGSLLDWVRLIAADFQELPDLQLTKAQVEERWEIDAELAQAALAMLTSRGVLKQTADGVYSLANCG